MKKATDGLSDEVKEMIRTGNEYIIQIKESNDAIKGEEISEKISHMQMIGENFPEGEGASGIRPGSS